MTEIAKGLYLTEDGQFQIGYRNEVDVRRTLAQLARAHGWLVREEVVVPGWGRIDLVLTEPVDSAPYLIEIKVDLLKPAHVRRAFQQADGYGRWWTREHNEQTIPVLTACNAIPELIAPVADVYPSVTYLGVSRVMAGLATWGDPQARTAHAKHDLQRLRELVEIYEKALADLAERNPEPAPEGTAA